MKDKTKAALIDVILQGKEIRVTRQPYITQSPDYVEAIWTLHQAGATLFQWIASPGDTDYSGNPITLKQALELVNKHWKDRVEAEDA